MSISQNYPEILPSLSLDFARVKKLDPRITFARASEGRYYDGVTTAKAEENLLLASQIFNSSFWIKSNASVTVDSIAAPDGTTTADTFTATANNGYLLQSYTAPSSASYTFSIYVKRKTGTGNFDLSINNGVSYETKSVTADWTRVSITATGTVGSVVIRLATSGDEVYLWGAQLEQRSAVTAYTPTTTQPITNYIPVLQTASANVARFDHDPVTGESLGLLVEEQRTNLFTYSEQFDNAAWAKTRSSITANAVVAPDGTLTGDKFVEDTTASASHLITSASSSFTTGSTYTVSMYAKAGERTQFGFNMSATVAGFDPVLFDLSNGTVIGNGSFSSTSITSVGNGWYRCTGTITATGTASTGVIFRLASGGSTTYTGDGYSGVYLWGAQLESGQFSTSYIPTTSSQVTRSADAASMTGTNFSEWFSNAEGTLYAEFMRQGTNTSGQEWRIFALGDIDLSVVTNQTRFKAFGDSNVNLYPGDYSADVYSKIAGAYKVNDFAASINGGTVVADTVGTLGTVTAAYIGNRPTGGRNLNGHIKKLAYYPLRLSNANLQALTGS